MSILGALCWWWAIGARNEGRMTPFTWFMTIVGTILFVIGLPGITKVSAIIGFIFLLMARSARQEGEMTAFSWATLVLGLILVALGIPGILRVIAFFAQFA